MVCLLHACCQYVILNSEADINLELAWRNRPFSEDFYIDWWECGADLKGAIFSNLLLFRMNRRLIFALLLAALSALFPASGFCAHESDGIFQEVDEPPVPLKTPPPIYPYALRRAGISGIVAVSIVIDEKGSVIDAAVSKSSNVEFERPSLEALHGWKFRPGRVDGSPVKVRVVVPMHFRVQG